MKKFGITNEGKSLETLVLRLCLHARKNLGKSKNDDIEIEKDGMKFFIEVKNNSWNQVRAIKYLPVVGCVNNQFYVMPPDQVLLAVSKKKTGQHTHDAFICSGFGIPDKSNPFWKQFLLEDNELLEEKIINAFIQGEKNYEYKQFCINKKLKDEIRQKEDWNDFNNHCKKTKEENDDKYIV